ncbi:MAG: Riboflavin synthase, alpha subunit, partial [uncultured bacterium]
EVNLEQAMKMSDELGGHIVQGHVDCTVICDKVLVIGEGWRYTLKLPSVKPKGVVLKGSVALDGISLTISRLEKNTLSVDIIPFTHENTNIKHWKKGTLINLETDVIGKYVEKYLSPEKNIWSNPVKSKKN